MTARIPEEEVMTDVKSVAEFNAFCQRYLGKIGYQVVVETLRNHQVRKGKVADLGSGCGHLSMAIRRSNTDLEMTALDLSQEMTAEAKKNVAAVGGITCVVADISALAESDDTYNAAVSFASLHHWRDPHRIFCEAQRVVKPGGLIVLYDLKRDAAILNILKMIPSRKLQELLRASVQASYTVDEVKALLAENAFSRNWKVHEHAMTLGIIGTVEK